VRPPDATAALSLDQVVEFPSRDGFEISLDMTVEFELLPEQIASIYQSYGDLPAVVDNIIMPQILSVSRLKGSAYRAKDFIVGEGREQFQNDLKETLARTLGNKRIVIHNALIRHVNVPMQILDPIQQASIAVEQNLTNKEKQNTARKRAELNTEQGLIEQRREQVAQETEKLKAEVAADREKQVAEIGAEGQKQVAEIRKETAAVRADKVRTLGQAQAEVVTLVEGEKAAGFGLKAAALGDPRAYTLWEFADSLNGEIRVNILHAGSGTLWTDIEQRALGNLGGAKVLQPSATGDSAPGPQGM
jgi:regulator of protease activity HflC (stomatin/prohibitin superfamily)